MPNPKRARERKVTSTERLVKVNLKSIRSPKFSVSVDNVAVSNNILMVKEQLLGDPDGPLADTNYQVTNLRFLIKGKVISDATSLEDVIGQDESELSFTVMLTQPPEPPSPEGEESPVPQTLEINESLWADIRGVIVKRLGEAQGEKVFVKLRSSW